MRDPDEAATRCRCQDPGGTMWIYLNPFCRYAGDHRPWADYGFPHTSLDAATTEYHRAWLAGDYDADLPPEAYPGYRPPDRGGDIPEYVARQDVSPMAETSYTPPIFPSPIIPATEVGLLQHFSRNGKVKKVEVDLDVKTPPGLLAALRVLTPHMQRELLRIVITYARGYVSNEDGSPRRRPIWESVDPQDNDGRTKIKIGEHPPEPADSIRLSVNLRRDLTGVDVARQMAYGHWIDAKPDAFGARSPDGRYLQSLGYTPWLERLKSWPT